MAAQQAFNLKGAAAGTYSTSNGTLPGDAAGLSGGLYALAVVLGTATSVQLQTLGPDGATGLNVGSAVTANSVVSPIYLPGGQASIVIVGGTASVSLARVLPT